MSEAEGQAVPLHDSWRAHWRFARFAYETLITPWPVFILLLAVIAAIGGQTPLVEIRAMTGLLNALTARPPTSGSPNARGLFGARTPYLKWVLLLVGIRIVSWTIYMESFQRYLAAQLNERGRASTRTSTLVRSPSGLNGSRRRAATTPCSAPAAAWTTKRWLFISHTYSGSSR